MVRAIGLEATQDQLLKTVQDSLFSIGAELATPEPEKHSLKWAGAAHVETLEKAIDDFDSQLPQLRTFVLPGGSLGAAHLHVARTVCRRTEREIVKLGQDPRISDVSEIVVYLNRLSDLLFVMARLTNQIEGVPDVPWQSPLAKN
jgi:cob(I)alamin adenosyltransferase